jgi:hypothetical protein
MIDNMQVIGINKNSKNINEDHNVLNTEIYNSILNQTASMYKDKSILLKKNAENVSIIKDSIDNLIDYITHAENDSKKKNKIYNTKTINSVKTIKLKNSARGIVKSEFKHKIADVNSLKAIKEKLVSSIKGKYNVDLIKKKDSLKNKEISSKPFHKSTLSMPKLTNNIFYIINQNQQVNTHITIYQNEKKISSSPGLKNNKVASEVDKNYKKLSKLDNLNSNPDLKRSETKFTKTVPKTKLYFADDKSSKGNMTARNVKINNIVLQR